MIILDTQGFPSLYHYFLVCTIIFDCDLPLVQAEECLDRQPFNTLLNNVWRYPFLQFKDWVLNSQLDPRFASTTGEVAILDEYRTLQVEISCPPVQGPHGHTRLLMYFSFGNPGILFHQGDHQVRLFWDTINFREFIVINSGEINEFARQQIFAFMQRDDLKRVVRFMDGPELITLICEYRMDLLWDEYDYFKHYFEVLSEKFRKIEDAQYTRR
jgi:hypothetical protein